MGGGRGRIFGEIFVAFESNRDSDLGLGAAGSATLVRGGRWPHYTQDASAAANRHALTQSDFGRHAEGQFDFSANLQCCVGEEEYATRTEVLSEAQAFDAIGNLTERYGE